MNGIPNYPWCCLVSGLPFNTVQGTPPTTYYMEGMQCCLQTGEGKHQQNIWQGLLHLLLLRLLLLLRMWLVPQEPHWSPKGACIATHVAQSGPQRPLHHYLQFPPCG